LGKNINLIIIATCALLLGETSYADECKGIWQFSSKFKDLRKPVINGNKYRVIPHKKAAVNCAIVTQSLGKVMKKSALWQSTKKIPRYIAHEMALAVQKTYSNGCKVNSVEILLTKQGNPVDATFVARWDC